MAINRTYLHSVSKPVDPDSISFPAIIKPNSGVKRTHKLSAVQVTTVINIHSLAEKNDCHSRGRRLRRTVCPGCPTDRLGFADLKAA